MVRPWACDNSEFHCKKSLETFICCGCEVDHVRKRRVLGGLCGSEGVLGSLGVWVYHTGLRPETRMFRGGVPLAKKGVAIVIAIIIIS